MYTLGTLERKARQNEELKEKILDAAEGLFASEGPSRVTMRRIAEEVEYSQTVLYRLFANKADLLEQAIARGYAGVSRAYEGILARDLTPADRLGEIVAVYATYGLDHPDHYRLWFATGDICEAGGQLVNRHGQQVLPVYRVWLSTITDCQTEGLYPGRAPIIVFQMIWTAIHGLISARIQHPNFPWLPAEEHVAQLMQVLEAGMA